MARRFSLLRPAWVSLLVIGLLAHAVRTGWRVLEWQSNLTLWHAAVSTDGTPRAWLNLGAAYAEAADAAAARECYAAAVVTATAFGQTPIITVATYNERTLRWWETH